MEEIIPLTKGQQQAIDCLTMMLAKAEAGEVLSVSIVGELTSGESAFCHSQPDNVFNVAGMLIFQAIKTLGFQEYHHG